MAPCSVLEAEPGAVVELFNGSSEPQLIKRAVKESTNMI
jgi:hypothetical protein